MGTYTEEGLIVEEEEQYQSEDEEDAIDLGEFDVDYQSRPGTRGDEVAPSEGGRRERESKKIAMA